MISKKKNYVNNKEFLELIIRYKDSDSKKDYEKIGRIFLLIVNGLTHKVNFMNYHGGLKDEMASLALERMVKNIKNFDEVKYDNPHAYFTTIAWWSMVHVLNQFHKEEKVFVRISFMDSLNEADEHNEDYDDTYKLDESFVVDTVKKMNSYMIDIDVEHSVIENYVQDMNQYNIESANFLN